MIKSFEEYINELWSKGIHRSKTGKKRAEDNNVIDRTCEFCGIFIAGKLKIEYSPGLCTYEYDDNGRLWICFDFGVLGEEYSQISYEMTTDDVDMDDDDDFRREFRYQLYMFQDGDFEYEYYRDEYISSKKTFNRIKKILSLLVDEL